jgi:protein-disulfide isomerase
MHRGGGSLPLWLGLAVFVVLVGTALVGSRPKEGQVATVPAAATASAPAGSTVATSSQQPTSSASATQPTSTSSNATVPALPAAGTQATTTAAQPATTAAAPASQPAPAQVASSTATQATAVAASASQPAPAQAASNTATQAPAVAASASQPAPAQAASSTATQAPAVAASASQPAPAQAASGTAAQPAAPAEGTKTAAANLPKPDVPIDELMKPGPLPENTLGDPKAPVTVVEYASMTCPHCADFHKRVFPDFKKKYIDTGKVYFVFREFPLDDLALTVSMLARCTGPVRYFAFVSSMYERQDEWHTGDNDLPKLQALMKQAGFTDDSFKKCVTDQALLDGINKVQDKAEKTFNVHGTPTFFVNGGELKAGHELSDLDGAIAPFLKS